MAGVRTGAGPQGPTDDTTNEPRGEKTRAMLRARLGDDIFTSWFHALEFEGFDAKTVKVSVPVKFLKTWIQSHYSDDLLSCCRAEFKGAEQVEVTLRQPGMRVRSRVRTVSPLVRRPTLASTACATPMLPEARGIRRGRAGGRAHQRRRLRGLAARSALHFRELRRRRRRTAWRMRRATQVAETVMAEERGFNPLYLHCQRRPRQDASPARHRLGGEAAHAQRAGALSDGGALPLSVRRGPRAARTRWPSRRSSASIDILLIDDLEFMHGEKTEQEFEHIINSLLDGGRQVVVASARAPGQLERLNERMRSRLQRGLVTEIGAAGRTSCGSRCSRSGCAGEAGDRSLLRRCGARSLDLLAERLDRERARARRRRQPPLSHLAADAHRRSRSTSPRRSSAIWCRASSRGASRSRTSCASSRGTSACRSGDILSQRRHRSVVRPRQIGMYLAKQLTSRSLPEIGRRFGNRDHTTVLHAIRKIEGSSATIPGSRTRSRS